MKTLFALVLTLCALALSACCNKYEIPTYTHTDSYHDIFEGRYVPQDVR